MKGKRLKERYQLQEQLADKANRQTWLAEDLETDPVQLCVVKLLPFSPHLQWQDLKLFEREAQVLRQLDHPRIPAYLDSFAIEADSHSLPCFALVQEYISGKSLQTWLQEGRRFTEEEGRRIATQLLDTLIYLHELSPPVLHRDIKPSNLILNEQGAIYLIDFGAVQDRARAEGATFTVVGTGGYVPPEQLWGRAVPASDLYALGATLIHLLTGIAPAELAQKHMRLQFRDRVSLRPAFAHWLEKLTDPAPEQRFSQTREALADLRVIDDAPPKRVNPRSHIPHIRYGNIAGLSLLQYTILIMIAAVFFPMYNMWQHGKTYAGGQKVYYLNMEQQGYFRQHGHFSTQISNLAKGALPSQDEDYRFDTVVKPTLVVNHAVPRRKILYAHVGAVYRLPNPPSSQSPQPSKEATILMIQCQAVSPGKALLPDPILQDGLLQCPSGTEFRDGHPGFITIKNQVTSRGEYRSPNQLRGVPLADQTDWEKVKQFENLVYTHHKFDRAEALAKQVQNPDLRRDLLRKLDGARGNR